MTIDGKFSLSNRDLDTRAMARAARRDARWQFMENWGFSRMLKKGEVNHRSFGRAYGTKLNRDGLRNEWIDETLQLIKSCAQWPVIWERRAGELVKDGLLVQATSAYAQCFMVGKAPTRDARRHIYEKMQSAYIAAEHEHRLESFSVDVDGQKIAAYLQVPETNQPPPVIIMFPGIGNTKESMHQSSLALLRSGIATCRVDVPGFGGSDGPIGDGVPVTNAIIDHLLTDTRLNHSRLFAMGTCGGGLYAAACPVERDLKGIILISTPLRPAHYVHKMPYSIRKTMEEASHTNNFPDMLAAMMDIKMLRPTKINCPVHIVQGGRDDMVPPREFELLMRYVKHPVFFNEFANEDHGCWGQFDDVITLIRECVESDGLPNTDTYEVAA